MSPNKHLSLVALFVRLWAISSKLKVSYILSWMISSLGTSCLVNDSYSNHLGGWRCEEKDCASEVQFAFKVAREWLHAAFNKVS